MPLTSYVNLINFLNNNKTTVISLLTLPKVHILICEFLDEGFHDVGRNRCCSCHHVSDATEVELSEEGSLAEE